MTFRSEQSYIEVTAEHSPWAFVYDWFTPTIEINGTKERKPWGMHVYALPPGDYEVSVSYPWAFQRECGKSAAQVHLEAHETRKVRYCARLIRYLPGKISVS